MIGRKLFYNIAIKNTCCLMNCKLSQRAAQKNKLFSWLVTNTPQSSSLRENSLSQTEGETLLIDPVNQKDVF